ncbi:MAG: hypothetical protein LC713_01205 [Actinobacteria bacterium]|nr:hypothetical protein [Actinomycetota bacterium]
MVDDEHTTEELRAIQAGRERAEASRALDADDPGEARASERRAEKARYLADRLAEQAESDDG